jgi:transposase-like protein
MKVAEEVLKQDTRGRVRVSRERREAMLVEFERSGMSGAKFARLSGINYQTFAGWVRRRKRDGEEAGMKGSVSMLAAQGGPVRLIEALVGEECSSSGALEVELPGGSRMRIDSPAQLAMAAELLMLVAQSGRARC